MLIVIAFLVTFISGFIGASILGVGMNWPDAGAIVSVAVMGSIILWYLEKDKKDKEKDS